MLDESQIKQLVDKAIQAKEFSYSPYSKFRVGCSLLTKDDQIYTGSYSVGKSSLTIRLTENRFEREYDPIIRKIFNHKLNTNGTDYELLIYDTTGLEQHSQIYGEYINWDGFILVYSISDLHSFLIVQDIFETLADELARESIPIVLIGNKLDLSDQRRVSYEEGEKLAKKWKANFYETSALSGKNVTDVFIALLNLIDPPNNNHHLNHNNNNNHVNNSNHNSTINNNTNQQQQQQQSNSSNDTKHINNNINKNNNNDHVNKNKNNNNNNNITTDNNNKNSNSTGNQKCILM